MHRHQKAKAFFFNAHRPHLKPAKAVSKRNFVSTIIVTAGQFHLVKLSPGCLSLASRHSSHNKIRAKPLTPLSGRIHAV